MPFLPPVPIFSRKSEGNDVCDPRHTESKTNRPIIKHINSGPIFDNSIHVSAKTLEIFQHHNERVNKQQQKQKQWQTKSNRNRKRKSRMKKWTTFKIDNPRSYYCRYPNQSIRKVLERGKKGSILACTNLRSYFHLKWLIGGHVGALNGGELTIGAPPTNQARIKRSKRCGYTLQQFSPIATQLEESGLDKENDGAWFIGMNPIELINSLFIRKRMIHAATEYGATTVHKNGQLSFHLSKSSPVDWILLGNKFVKI